MGQQNTQQEALAAALDGKAVLDRETAEDVLRQVGAGPDESFDLGETALVLAALDRPRVSFDRYRQFLRTLGEEAAAALQEAGGTPDVEDAAAILNSVLFEANGFEGDSLTYDDLQNANLMRVIDRRKGLPIALGILYIHAARQLGWAAHGVNFPAHFLVQLDLAGARALIDPFNKGRVCTAPQLRDLAKGALGADAELRPAFYAPIADRDILVRLQNNLKFRMIRGEDFDGAIKVVRTMQLFAPGDHGLWHEEGLLEARLGHPAAAIDAFESFLEMSHGEHPNCHEAASLLQELKSQIN